MFGQQGVGSSPYIRRFRKEWSLCEEKGFASHGATRAPPSKVSHTTRVVGCMIVSMCVAKYCQQRHVRSMLPDNLPLTGEKAGEMSHQFPSKKFVASATRDDRVQSALTQPQPVSSGIQGTWVIPRRHAIVRPKSIAHHRRPPQALAASCRRRLQHRRVTFPRAAKFDSHIPDDGKHSVAADGGGDGRGKCWRRRGEGIAAAAVRLLYINLVSHAAILVILRSMIFSGGLQYII